MKIVRAAQLRPAWNLFLLTAASLVVTILSVVPVFAGGPLYIGGPGFGVDGQPFTWASMPIHYRVDGGAMASTSAGQTVISNATGIARVQSMFQTWQNVSTAAVSFTNDGSIIPVAGFSDGDVSTVAEFNAVFGSCQQGTQNPIIFDANGSLIQGLGLSNLVIGFSSQCSLSSNGRIVSDMVVLNGAFQNGVTQPQLDTNQFNEAIIHEMGHLLGLAHSQINLDLFTDAISQNNIGNCDLDRLAGLPLMFPISFCQARLDAGLPQLAPDDVAWISRLYPSATYNTTYATIAGTIFFSDGTSQAQDVNVIAREVDDANTPQDESKRVAFSAVSGYRFTDNPGQTVTAQYLPCNTGQSGCPTSGFLDENSAGDQLGSRDASLIGSYDIPVLAGSNYTVQVESIDNQFTGGSSVGPIDPPIPMPGVPEFWNKQESSNDDPTASDPISTTPGQSITGTDIILNGSEPRFDQFEDGGSELWYEQIKPWRHEVGDLLPEDV